MTTEKIERIAMACFVEGIELSSLGLAPHHLAQGETYFAEFVGECDTETYYRCLEALLNGEEGVS